MSRELPILCAAPVVRAILDGRQTQDRRPIKPQPPVGEEVWPCHWVKSGFSFTRLSGAPPLRGCTCGGEVRPPWREGDVLYVRETWNVRGACWSLPISASKAATPDAFVYAATPPEKWVGGWRPSIHMPKWAARIRLRVLSVGVERVNAISEEDARAEGCEGCAPKRGGVEALEEAVSPREEFAALWDSLYGVGSFDRGDWCWVTRFERVVP